MRSSKVKLLVLLACWGSILSNKGLLPTQWKKLKIIGVGVNNETIIIKVK